MQMFMIKKELTCGHVTVFTTDELEVCKAMKEDVRIFCFSVEEVINIEATFKIDTKDEDVPDSE